MHLKARTGARPAHPWPAPVIAGIIPVKRLDTAKRRLAPHLGAAMRRQLATALLEDVLSLARSAEFLRWWVVSDDDEVRTIARERGFGTAPDPGRGLNAALVEAIAVVERAGATSAVVVPTDVPLAAREDLLDLVDTGETSDVVVVPGGSGGTNGLHLRPPGLMVPRFGPWSLQAHVDAAHAAGLRCTLLPLPRMAIDIDTIEDVRACLEVAGEADSRALGILRRLRLPGAD